VGGRGVGKSWVGAYDLFRRSKPDRLYLVAAPTYPMLMDSSFRSFLSVGRLTGLLDLSSVKRSAPPAARLRNGAEVIFRSADDPERLRGPNLSGAWLDEASQMDEGAFNIVIAALREGGESGWLSATFTPRGRMHWTYEVFGTGSSDTELIHARTTDNPFLPPDFAGSVLRQYGESSMLARQELGGEFVDSGGLVFQRHWFKVVDSEPAKVTRWVRSWDLAATAAKEGKDPDWTVGCKMGQTEQKEYVIADVRRMRGTPLEVERLVRSTAEEDGRSVDIYMEQEPGSSGVNTVDHYLRNVLAGWKFKGVRATGPKEERARPLSGMAEAGHVYLLRGGWNRTLLDEFESFPLGKFDDQIDSASLCLAQLAEVKWAFDLR